MSDHTRSGLPENIAALLSYVLGWVTGLGFLLIDKRPYVRFHAAQSIIVFLGLQIFQAVLGPIFGMGWWFVFLENLGTSISFTTRTACDRSARNSFTSS